jgi:hypothetical protein
LTFGNRSSPVGSKNGKIEVMKADEVAHIAHEALQNWDQRH